MHVTACMHAEFSMLPMLAAVDHAAISNAVYAGDISVRKGDVLLFKIQINI